MSGEIKIAERLKADLLDELHLMKPADLQAYWQQAKWPKPNLVELARSEYVETRGNKSFAPLRYALMRLPPEILAQASDQLDPFGWLLAAVDMNEWSEFCRARHVPWMTRVWLAAASQLRAERRLIFKAHGWSDTWEELKRNPKDLHAAEDFFSAQLSHAREQRRDELLTIRVIGLSEASRRRLRRSKKVRGKRDGVVPAEKFTVQHWLELPNGLPGLCFFSDPALDGLLEAFGLNTGTETATKQIRVRLGLLQAGAKRHLVEEVVNFNSELRFTGSKVKNPWVIKGNLRWGKRTLWPH
jgi:hypothetical protein